MSPAVSSASLLPPSHSLSLFPASAELVLDLAHAPIPCVVRICLLELEASPENTLHQSPYWEATKQGREWVLSRINDVLSTVHQVHMQGCVPALQFKSRVSSTFGRSWVSAVGKGKGFPDVSTRQLLKRLGQIRVSQSPMGSQSDVPCDQLDLLVEQPDENSIQPSTIPMLALVDCDPHGIDIFLCYKYGAQSTAYDSKSMTAPSLSWIGMELADLSSVLHKHDSILALSDADARKIRSIRRLRPELARIESRVWRELEHMLRYGCKFEIELCSPEVLMTSYLPAKVAEYLQEYPFGVESQSDSHNRWLSQASGSAADHRQVRTGYAFQRYLARAITTAIYQRGKRNVYL
ncbi:Spo11/DNA topoisomerase VI subunit A [Polychytrium aggregatum]|uniref:Spo11/DNA topoisomerase VI subunit A n=1 Tax=Polychytrium aggregatum TaxID=110093 RepID=UPI0022FEA03B|nr:Spo11/DNA topoisomerase VI subunit A [Polychytrium aggregatum]KAI9206680.1 Spo11/DNA topoisomerase VI subunit A [Polychytrium aggregatum]